MPRIARMYSELKVYHIIIRGIDKQDIEKSSDGYSRKYVYEFGIIYAHEMTPLEDCELYSLLGEPIKKENIF